MSAGGPYRLLQGTARIADGGHTGHGGRPFGLESGEALPVADVRYAIYGEPNEACDNVVLVCHALSGSARVDQWWPVLLGNVFDLERECVVCTNVIGSCYGSTGPRSIDPHTRTPYGSRFPRVTVRDMVRAQALALSQLGIERLRVVVGSSLGGMQALQWAIDFPERVEKCIAIGAAPLSALALGLNHIQRQVLELGSDTDSAGRALAIARAIAMLSYKSGDLLEERHARRANRAGAAPWLDAEGRFDIAGYLDHQGRIFVERFDPHTYSVLTRAMDLFDPARDYGSTPVACERILARVLLVGISSDWLFPATDVRRLAAELRGAGIDTRYHELISNHGHDAFLAEPEKLIPVVREFLREERRAARFAAVGSAEGEHDGTRG